MNRQSDSKKPNIFLLAVAGALLVGLVLAVVFFAEPLVDLFGSPERVRQVVGDAGPFGPLVYILLQVVQVFVAPIPGQVVGLAGGFLFGTWLGTLYSMVGALIGFTLVFLLARKLGRPFVEYFVDKKMLAKFDYLTETRGVFVLFLIFLLPAFPDDIICFMAGLTNIKIRTLILISLAGRLPGYFVLSLTGSGVAEGNFMLSAVVFGIALAAGALAFWQRKRIEQFVKRFVK